MLVLETIYNLPNLSGIFNHWFWLNENTLIYSVSEVGGTHQICVNKFNDSQPK